MGHVRYGVRHTLVAAVAFVPLGWVTVKMLPFDNKSELQVIVLLSDDAPLK